MVVIFSREKKLLVQLFVWWKTNCLSMLSTSLLCKAVPLDSTFVENNIVSCDPKTASVQFLRVVFIRKYYTCMYVTDGRNKFFWYLYYIFSTLGFFDFTLQNRAFSNTERKDEIFLGRDLLTKQDLLIIILCVKF